jgi:hypothetical protein
MRTHRAVVLSCLFGALFVGASSGAVLVVRTVGEYSGACEKLDGFPGVLQAAGFLPHGDCRADPNGKRACPEHSCRADGKKGHCEAREVDKRFFCTCIPNRISR